MMRGMSGYSGSPPGSRVSMVVAFLLGMALLTTIVAIAVAMGLLRLSEPGQIAGASPSPTAIAAASPTAEPTAELSPEPATEAPATAAPTATAEPSPDSQPTPGGTHIVQSGESLFSISQLYGVPMGLIAEANQLANPDRIFLGQELIIPVPGEASPEANVHYVQPGESISSIALLYDVTPTELADVNEIENWDLIFVGQALIIPGREPAVSPTPDD
jgi:LysM repeat protein